MIRLNKTTQKIIAATGVALLLLLLVCVLIFGKPFITDVEGINEEQIVSYRIWNLTAYPVSWTYSLLDENGQAVPSDYFPEFVTTSQAILIFGTGTDVIKLARPLPAGNYTLRIVFRYNACGAKREAVSEQRFTIEP